MQLTRTNREYCFLLLYVQILITLLYGYLCKKIYVSQLVEIRKCCMQIGQGNVCVFQAQKQKTATRIIQFEIQSNQISTILVRALFLFCYFGRCRAGLYFWERHFFQYYVLNSRLTVLYFSIGEIKWFNAYLKQTFNGRLHRLKVNLGLTQFDWLQQLKLKTILFIFLLHKQ